MSNGTFFERYRPYFRFSADEMAEKRSGMLFDKLPALLRPFTKQVFTARGQKMMNRLRVPQTLGAENRRLVAGSPLLLAVMLDRAEYRPGELSGFYSLFSMGAAMENVWLTTVEIGMGIQFVSFPMEVEGQWDRLVELFGVPDDLELMAVYRLGYLPENGPARDRLVQPRAPAALAVRVPQLLPHAADRLGRLAPVPSVAAGRVRPEFTECVADRSPPDGNDDRTSRFDPGDASAGRTSDGPGDDEEEHRGPRTTPSGGAGHHRPAGRRNGRERGGARGAGRTRRAEEPPRPQPAGQDPDPAGPGHAVGRLPGPGPGIRRAGDAERRGERPYRSVPGQVVPGFSGVVANDDGTYWAMPDNGFGSKANSADFLLRLYLVKPSFETAKGGSGAIKVQRFISLRDPDHRIGFPLVNGDTPDRLLTGADFDIESIVRQPDGTFWIGEEFGPFLLHVSRSGKLLAAPVPFVGGKSPDNPTLAAGETPTIGSSRGFEAMAGSKDGRHLYPILEGALNADTDKRRRVVYEFDTKKAATRRRPGRTRPTPTPTSWATRTSWARTSSSCSSGTTSTARRP